MKGCGFGTSGGSASAIFGFAASAGILGRVGFRFGGVGRPGSIEFLASAARCLNRSDASG